MNRSHPKRKSRRFSSEDQTAFAELSGDYNPLHVNALVARRLLFGAPVVHGIHSLLWALDGWLEERPEHVQLRSLEVAFPKPLRVGEEARVSVTPVGEGHVKIEVIGSESIVTGIDCEWDPSNQQPNQALDKQAPEKREPCVLPLEGIAGKSGVLELRFNPEAAAKMFPSLTKLVSPLQIAVLLSTTRLVGMECPGWHSVFSELKLAPQRGDDSASLKYEVTKFDRRFGMVLMKVSAPGLAGTIQAFVRPPAQEQITYLKAKQVVQGNEFSGQRALVIGGSRGLGEVTAKLLAAGGARVRITYHQGRAEAERIVHEIISNGGVADALQVDVLSASQNALGASLNQEAPTHLYYFATPFIFAGNKGAFSTSLFHKFCDYYVTGFLNIMNSLKGREVMKVFHPSSVAVEEMPPDMGEYAAAKMAAEVMCLNLEKNNRTALRIYKPRLPRMGTDQTASCFPVHNQDPVPIMLKHLCVFKDM